MRRLLSMLAGAAGLSIIFLVGFTGSSVTPDTPSRVAVSRAGGASFRAPPVLALTPSRPAVSEVVITPPDLPTCRPLSQLSDSCPEPPPGAVVGAMAGLERWRSLVAAHFRADDVERAMSIISCESNGDPMAANPTSSARGLFQHLESLWPERAVDAGRPGADIFDPVDNIAVAAWLVYHGGGWSHWNASGQCW